MNVITIAYFKMTQQHTQNTIGLIGLGKIHINNWQLMNK